MTQSATERAAGGFEPDPEPCPPGGDEPRPVDPPSVFSDGVALARLIGRAQLTVAQAIELGAAVSAEAVRRSGPCPGEPGLAGQVIVGADGRVVPGRPPVGPALGSVLRDLADAVRPRARCAGPAAEQLLAELDGAVQDLPVADAVALSQRLREVAAAIDRGTVRAELGALVRAIGAGPAPAGTARPPGTAPSRSHAPRRAGTGRRRIGAWVLSVLVLAGVVVGEFGVLRQHIGNDIGALLTAGRSGSSTSAPKPAGSPEPGGVPVSAPAPAAAGSVAGVDLRALSPCVPGSPCTVRLQVRLAPRPVHQVVSWSYRVVDRCAGASVRAAGGSVAVPAGDTRLEATSVLALPAAAHAVAVFAITTAPAVAASPPLLLGTCPSPAVAP